MKRRNRNQIISPKMSGPPRRTPSTRTAGTLIASTLRSTSPITIGPPTSNPRKTVRRDQSISPSERSKIRAEAVASEGICRAGGVTSLHQILEDRGEIVVRRGDLVDPPRLAARRQLRETRVERVGPCGLHHQRVGLERQAQHIVVGQEAAGQRTRVLATD